MTVKKRAIRKKSVTQASPDPELVDGYVPRVINGVPEAKIFAYAHKNKLNVLLEGDTGSGKTSAVLNYAVQNQLPFYSVPSNVSIDPTQLFGRFIPTSDGAFEWVDGGLTNIVRNGGVLLLNEINFMPERIASVLYGLLDKRREITLLDHKGEVIRANDNLLVVADMNPSYEGTRPLNKAFRNRFAIQLQWNYDSKVDRKLVRSADLMTFASQVRTSPTIKTPLSTNMLVEFIQLFDEFGYQFARNNMASHFHVSEREAMSKVLDTHKKEITAQLTVPVKEMETYEVSTGISSKYPPEHPIWKIREEAPDGHVDPEFGIKGKDWVL